MVEIAATDEPDSRYRISVKNVSSQPTVNFHVIAHRDDRRALSGSRGNLDGTPIIEPGGIRTFVLDAGREPLRHSADVVLSSHDVIEIASVLWEDGSIEGEASEMALALAVYLARADQLTRGVRILRSQPVASASRERLLEQIATMSTAPSAALLAQVKARLQHMENVDERRVESTLQPTLASIRRRILSDLDNAPSGAGFARWLAEIARVYEGQAERLASR